MKEINSREKVLNKFAFKLIWTIKQVNNPVVDFNTGLGTKIKMKKKKRVFKRKTKRKR